MSAAAGPNKVSRADIEEALRAFEGGAKDEVESRKKQLALVGIAVVVVVLGITYFLGSRRGKRKTTYVEIRRF